MRHWRSWWQGCVCALMLIALGATVAGAQAAGEASPPGSQDYVIGADDVLGISVWMRPELERTVTVNAQGNITFPPIGEIKAAGLTARQLSDRLSDRLSTYLRQTTTVTVSVTQFMSRSIFVSGAVTRPGRYGFEHLPALLDVINAAGGALPTADLSRVQILRREGGALRSLPADLTVALQQGSVEGLPALEPGDVVVVPTSAAGGALTADAAGVLGEVHRPGLYSVGTGQDLWMVLAQAGGPTQISDLTSIRVLTRGQDDALSSATVNLDRSLRRGARSPILIKPGDIVYLSPRGTSAWQTFLQVLGLTRDVASTVAVIRVLNE